MILDEYKSAFCNWHRSMYHGTFNIEKITNQHLIHVLIDSLKMNQMDDRINWLNFAKVNFCSIKSSNNKLIKVFFILNTTHRALCWIFHELISNILTLQSQCFVYGFYLIMKKAHLKIRKQFLNKQLHYDYEIDVLDELFWNDFRF